MKEKSDGRLALEIFAGVVGTVFGAPFVGMYVYQSLEYETFNMRKQYEIQEKIASQRIMKKEKDIFNSLDKEFKNMDSNNDGLVDVTEHLCYELSLRTNSFSENTQIASKNLYEEKCSYTHPDSSIQSLFLRESPGFFNLFTREVHLDSSGISGKATPSAVARQGRVRSEHPLSYEDIYDVFSNCIQDNKLQPDCHININYGEFTAGGTIFSGGKQLPYSVQDIIPSKEK